MNIMRLVILTVALTLISTKGLAFCFEPTPPFSKPSPPLCFDNVCDSWAVDSYRSEVDLYLNRLQNYADEALEYAECEARKAVNDWNDFVAWNKVRRR
ncbi:MAG: hypothetical protein MI785_15050 [Kiloniellales bacterium]|nr:hypothetical protein [Kiloniellales bacterium]